MIPLSTEGTFARLSPYIRFAHHFRTGEQFRIPRRVIYDHLLLYTKEGYCWVGIDDRQYRQAPGTLFFIRPRVLHSFHADNGHDNLLMYNLHFDFVQRDDSAQVPICRGSVQETLAYPEQFRSDPTTDNSCFLPEVIEHFVPDIYERFFFEILDHVSRPDLASRLRVKAAMTGLLAHLYQFHDLSSAQSLAGGALDRLEGITRFMHEHLQESLTLDHLAEQCNLSKSYFSACFKATYGETPIQYLTRLRIDSACYLLAHNNTPIKQISFDLGFPSVHYFTRIFSRLTGLPPAAYRRQYAVLSSDD